MGLSKAAGRRRSALASCCAGVGLAISPALAAAQDSSAESRQVVAECVAGHERSQTLQQAGRYLDARESVLSCSRPECPPVLRADCLEWFTTVERAIPSVVLAARVGTNDLIRVRVTIDGKVVTEQLDGRAHELDPGAHKFRLESLDRPELPAVESEVLVSRGEKARLLPFVFEDTSARQAPAPPPTPPRAKPVPWVPTHRPTPTVTYVLLGAAGVFAVGGGIIGVIGKSEESDLKKPYEDGGCAPYCEPEQVDSVRAKYALADIGFGLAVASGVGALVSYLIRPEVALGSSGKSGFLTLRSDF